MLVLEGQHVDQARQRTDARHLRHSCHVRVLLRQPIDRPVLFADLLFDRVEGVVDGVERGCEQLRHELACPA
jgi:hypothetical protein